MATRFADHLLEGDHAGRPAFGDVPQGTLYACSDHGLIYQSDGSTAWSTWATLGGDVSSHLSDATDAHDASAISVLDTAANFTGTDVEAVLAELQDNIDGVTGGVGIAQELAYPTTLTGDSDHFTTDDTGKWTNQDTTFETRGIVGGSIMRLGATGASQTSTIRQVLGTPKAGAFDIRTLIVPDIIVHSASDVTVAIVGLTSADSRVFEMRLTAHINSGGDTIDTVKLDCFGNASAGNRTEVFPLGTTFTFRITRDGGNLLRFYYGIGATPTMMHTVVDANRIPVAHSQTGTVEWIEYVMVVPAGPNASSQRFLGIDYFEIS